MIKISILAVFLLHVLTVHCKPRGASLEIASNFEFGLTKREFRVHYLGADSDAKSAQIKIYKQEETENALIQFNVLGVPIDKPKAFYLIHSDDLEDGIYEVQVCQEKSSGTDCSDRNPSLTSIITSDTAYTHIKCKKGTGIENTASGWTKSEDFEIPVIKPEGFLSRAELETIDSETQASRDFIKNSKEEAENLDTEDKKNDALKKLSDALETMAFPFPDTFSKKVSLKTSPTFEKVKYEGESKNVFHVAFKFNLKHYEDLFAKKNPDTTQPRAHSYCARKFILTGHAHLIDKTTREVKYRFKTALHHSPGVNKFLQDKSKNDGVMHIEIFHFVDVIVPKEYELSVSICTTEKDRNESTICSSPITQDITIEQLEEN